MMNTSLTVMAFSSLSDSLLVKVVTFLFTMMDRGVERMNINLSKCCNNDSCQFY